MTAVSSITQLASELLGLAKQFYERNGYGAAPLVVILVGDEDSTIIAAPEGVPPGTLYDSVIQMIKSVGFTPNMICMVMDTYALKIDKEDSEEAWKKADSLRAGDLSRMFAAGDPDVVEQLSVEVLRSGEEVMIALPYKYTPVDGWEWSEPSPVPEGTSSDWEFDRLIAGLPKKSYEEMKKERE